MHRRLIVIATMFLVGGLTTASRSAEKPNTTDVTSKAQLALAQAAEQKKYTFILFFKDSNVATQSMVQRLKDSVAKRTEQAALCVVQVTDPAERAVVERFDVARAPLPLAMAVAPNGAIMGVFRQKISDEQIADSFATPAMTHCMKSMQDGKLVMICVHATQQAATPPGVKDFQADPHFKDRTNVISVRTNDAAETDFFRQMKIDPVKAVGTTTVFFAPPGVLVGKFDGTATKSQLASALHSAGKCCDDPNCKHGQASQSQPAPTNGRRTSQTPNARRN